MASSTMMISIMTLMVVMMASTAVAQGNAYNWTTIRSNIGQICPGLDFYSPTSGYILDFVSGPGPILLHTSDGGATLTSALSGIDILIMENIVTANAGQQAVTGGVSLLEPISIQTNDGGSTWIKSTTVVLQSKFNGLQVLGNGDIVFFGSWSVRNSGEKGSTNYAGFAYSANQGNSYSYVNWPYPTITPVAGNFIGTSNTVVLIGSAAPYVASDNTDGYAQLLNHHKKGVPVFESDFPANETYRSYVAISTNSGATWNTIYSYEGVDNVTGISLGGGFFLTATTGFISGMNHTVAGSAAFLLGTTDGGATWVQLLQVPGGIFSRVECISANECFVIGGAPGGVLGNGVVYQTTNAGKTWTQTLIPKIAALTDISVVNSNTIYATAVTAFQTCDLLYWGPAQSASTSE